MAQPNDPMAEIRASFFVECEELLEALQDAMAAISDSLDQGGQPDGETINVAFRAVHSIKGGAGAFGLKALVAYAHRFETVLDELRAGRMTLDPEGMKLIFAAADILADQVRLANADPAASPPGAEEALLALEGLTGGGGHAPEPEPEVDDFVPLGLSFDFGGIDAGPSSTRWRLRFVPSAGLYRSGNEPLLLLRALATLGEAEIRCDLSRLPDFAAMDPEASYLGWDILLDTTAGRDEILEVFDFVEDLAEIELTEEGPAGDAPPPDPAGDPLPDPAPAAESDATAPPGPGAAAVPDRAPAPAAPPAAAARAEGGGAHPAETAGATVRVDLERIDRLVNLVGELVINQAMLAQSVSEAGLGANSAVMSGLEAFMMLTRDIQDSVMMIRAQPVKPLFQRMARIVREASGAVGKEVRLRTEGEGTEVDKTVIERLADPLTHMIRNAVDHGLEKPETRVERGKTREGIITLSAQHRSGRVVIEVSDDGGGINRPRVREIAEQKGLIPPEAQLSDSEIDNLLFLPGFSTASEVSALSGRGVGMDVVKQAIQALGGRITILSEPGKGTRFSISLPLTLAVLDGMVVKVAGETLVIPLSSIVETATLAAGDIRMLGPESSVIHIRGGFVPLYDLGAELGYREPRASYVGCIVLLTAQDDGSRAALVVEEIMEQRQVVIKGLQQGYGNIPGVAAATILGDGKIALILDPGDLVANATGRTRLPDFALTG
ncbi:chemotaxis protein CheA [Frigidibacter sp. MR17.24]|uniref:chemotaxis protein CheA n=1 Tax=Frigidibacter sp. MR17.24 TaxID=3127345 RepID=UPI003012CB26